MRDVQDVLVPREAGMPGAADVGLVKSSEPFTNLLTQGMVLKDGSKMSKSKGNTVDPQALVEQYGADTVRLFVMFAAPPEQSLEWSDSGVEGASRFLKRLWKRVADHANNTRGGVAPILNTHELNEAQRAMRCQVHEAITKISDDVGRRHTFNTAIAACMELINGLYRFEDNTPQGRAIMQEALEAIVLMLSPIVPHITHVLWHELGHADAVVSARWPQVDAMALVKDSIELVVQVNGKLRARVAVPTSADRAQAEAAALADENVQRFVNGKQIKKIVVVPGKLVNIVVVE